MPISIALTSDESTQHKLQLSAANIANTICQNGRIPFFPSPKIEDRSDLSIGKPLSFVLVQHSLNGGNFGGISDFHKIETIVPQSFSPFVRVRLGHQQLSTQANQRDWPECFCPPVSMQPLLALPVLTLEGRQGLLSQARNPSLAGNHILQISSGSGKRCKTL